MIRARNTSYYLHYGYSGNIHANLRSNSDNLSNACQTIPTTCCHDLSASFPMSYTLKIPALISQERKQPFDMCELG